LCLDGGEGAGVFLVHEGEGVLYRKGVEAGGGGVGLFGEDMGAVGDGHER
jgi:hypothetical protein